MRGECCGQYNFWIIYSRETQGAQIQFTRYSQAFEYCLRLLCDIEQSRRPAPNGDFVERISAFLNLDKSEYELLLDLAAKSRNTVSADLPDYIMEKDIVRAALRVAKEVDATDEEWQTFMKMLKERKR